MRKKEVPTPQSEKEQKISTFTRWNRDLLTGLKIADVLLPVGYTDPHNTIERLSKHLESGGSVVIALTHPTIEDALRAMRLFFMIDAIRDRKAAGPGAIHQKLSVQIITTGFGMETAWVVTKNTLKKAKKKGKKVERSVIRDSLVANNELIAKLDQNITYFVAPQADQESHLVPPPPDKPVISNILKQMKDLGISNVLFVPVGIEISGIEDYDTARNITLTRHPYIFNIGEALMDYELREEARMSGVSTDYIIYQRQIPLVPEGYILEQPDLA